MSGWYHPAMRMQNELIASKEREYALKERIRISETILTKTDKGDRPIPKERLSIKAQQNNVQPHNLEHVNEFKERMNQFDSLYQHILDLEKEMEKLRTELQETFAKQRENEIKIDELKVYENQFVELTQSLKSSDDTKESLLAEQVEQMVQLKNTINSAEKKTKFCQEDYECLNKIHKHTKEKQVQIIFELRKELIETRNQISEAQLNQKKTEPIDQSDKNEITQLRNELNILRNKTCYLNSMIVKNLKTLDNENEIGLNYERIEKLGVVRNNFVVDFITKAEYEDLESRCNILATRNDELAVHSNHLEKLLNLSQEQVQFYHSVNWVLLMNLSF